MLKYTILTLLFFRISLFSTAQITFQKTIGGSGAELGHSVQLTNDGGYIFCGNTSSFGSGMSDVYLVKTNAAGDTLWTRTFGGSNDDKGLSIAQTADSGFIICGQTGVAFSYNVYILKISSLGDSLWTRTIGGAGNDFGNCIIQSDDLGFLVVGTTNSYGAGVNDGYMIRLDAYGDMLWTKTLGGLQNDVINYVQQTTDGGYILTGTTSSNSSFSNIWLIKIDGFGNLTWSKTFGTSYYNFGNAVEQTYDGGYIVAGQAGAGTGMYIIKTDSAGHLEWSHTYGGAIADIAYGIEQTADSGFMISGTTQSFGATGIDMYLVKTDSTGNLLWSRTFGDTLVSASNADGTYYSRQANDGGYIIGGFTTSFGAGSYDLYILKIDSNGDGVCNERTPATIVSTLPTVDSNYIPAISMGGYFFSDSTTIGKGGLVATLCATVGVHEIFDSSTQLSLSPNPATNNFIVEFSDLVTKGTIGVYTILGERMMEQNILNASEKEINLLTISSGIYIVKITDGNKCYGRKLIVDRD